MTNEDKYKLARDYWASVRLNHQAGIWNDVFGYALHPSIPKISSDPEGLSIIDVGAGTGCWLLQVYQQLKVPVKQLIGADISNEQFPHHDWLPDKVKLIILDVLDPNGPPEELRGQFDVVHAQYLLSLVKDRPDQLIDFFSKLLKPGGYLQWGEPYNILNETKSANDQTEGLDLLLKHLKSLQNYSWLDFSDEDLKPFGLEILDFERRNPHAWQRRWVLDNWCMLMDEFAPKLGWSVEKIREMNQKAITEIKQGSYIEEVLQMLLATKRTSD